MAKRSNGNSNGNGQGTERGAGAARFDDISSRQILKALKAFEQGDYSVTDTVNARQLLKVLRCFKRGQFKVRLPEDQTGIAGEIAEVFNDCMIQQEAMAQEISRLNREVGREGKTRQRAVVENLTGGWSEQLSSLNELIESQNTPLVGFNEVIDRISQGDLSHPMEEEVGGKPLRGEYLKFVRATNRMLDQLRNFSSEVIRVSREVGRDGKLGGQAANKNAFGIWATITESVNEMADNLTSQVRGVADVTRAVAKGDLTKKKKSYDRSQR